MSMNLDIGPLSWVKGEIDLALERAGLSLDAHRADPAGDGLKKARASAHQAHGALAIVGLDGITEFARGIELLLTALSEGTTPDAGTAITAGQGGCSALRGYLDDLMAGHPNQPLKLLAPYQAMALARGQPAPGPAELFFPDLTQRPPKRDKAPPALAAEALTARLKAARLGFERGLLKWIKHDPKGIAEMKAAVTMIEMTRTTPGDRAYWWISLGVLDALAADGLPDPMEAKRFAMRLGGQIKKLVDGKTEVGELPLREALYQAACATGGGEALAIVRAAYRLDGMLPKATAAETERLLPHIRRLRELLASAKDEWNRLCAGTVAALVPFHERAEKIAKEAVTTGQQDYTRLAAAILDQSIRLRRDPSRHTDALALEVATALLLAESALEDFQSLDADFARAAQVVIDRLAALARGEEIGMHELPYLYVMSRRAQDRLLVESVAREIHSNLGAIEQTLDAFFRDPSRQASLAALEQPIHQIKGALLVLGEERANAVLAECAQAIEQFSVAGFTPRTGDFEAVAKKLSALGFFVTQLKSGGADIDAILEPPPVAPPAAEETDEAAPTAEATTPAQSVEGVVAPSLVPILPEPIPEPAPAEPVEESEPELDQALLEFEVESPPEPPAPTLIPIAAPVPSAETSRLLDASAEELDSELLGIFLEEAREVLATIDTQLPVLHAAPGDHDSLLTLRRSFHTLKGSGRMVGLTDLGEAAWAVEQVHNAWLHDARPATPALLGMLDHAADVFRNWVAQLETGGGSHFDAAELIRRCQVLGGAEDAEAGIAGSPAPTFAPPPAPAAPPEPVAPEAIEPEAITPEAITPKAAPPSAEVVSFPAPPPVRVGAVEVAPMLYNLYLEEARGHIATLQANLGLEEVPGNEVIRAAHTTASISAATGFMPISTLARALEGTLVRLSLLEAVPTDAQRFVFARCAGALEGMLGAVAERRMPGEEAVLTAELQAMVQATESAAEALTVPAREDAVKASAEAATADIAMGAGEPVLTSSAQEKDIAAGERRASRIEDEIDAQVLPLFLEESVDLMREIGELLRDWRDAPANDDIPRTLRRALHTLKGSARMAGAMGCGELLHSMEDRVDQAVAMKSLSPATVDGLETSYDRTSLLIEQLRNPPAAHTRDVPSRPAPPLASAVGGIAPVTTRPLPGVEPPAPRPAFAPGPQVYLRVRADLVDQLVNDAGEVAIARGRIEGELLALKTSLLELTDNSIRLRKQLREVEIQAETQMQSKLALASEGSQEFDPLEFDRFTHFQEMTRMMAERVNDVATAQQGMMQSLDQANAALVAQARLSRELSQRMMSVRMVPFKSLAERLHRVVRQAAKDCGKRANLDIRQGQTELDRSVLDKMVGPLEHLLRNSVAHGLEDTAGRTAANKNIIGQITVSLAQEGNEVVIAIADDGGGLRFDELRRHAIERGLIAPDAPADEAALGQLIFHPGFSTAAEVTRLAGRGVGLDVVKTETASLGGRVEVESAAGRGATFRIFLPLTLAVTQAVLAAAGNRLYAIPSSMIEQATENKPEAAAELRAAGGIEWLGNHYPYHYLSALLGETGATPPPGRRHWILLIKGGAERIALEVDSLSRTQEIVVKAVGPQLARVAGLAGATVLGTGEVALIINPIALALRAGARRGTAVTIAAVAPAAVAAPATVMVVDDSLTVRKITGRLLARHGYHVLTAKDGVDALEQLAENLPDVMLLDIEMPRMDGFELTRNMRGAPRLKDIPIIMITSRTAEKHRQRAAEIGVNRYLGKPYDEDVLLASIRECIAKRP